jgi:chorismate synthase
MPLALVTAGESHGPALVAILTGLPAGLVLDRDAIDADLRRRQEGYGRSPRQRIESDAVDVLAGLRHGRTLGTPLALVVRNRDHVNWEHGMSPWPPDGEPTGKGTKRVTVPRPGHADLSGVLKYGLELAAERGSAAHDEIGPGYRRTSNRAGGIEGGISNGEEVVVRAAMKPLPTLMRPLRTLDLDTGEPAEALVERSDVSAVEALAVVAEAAVAWELARAAREKFGGDALADLVAAHRAYLERIPWRR